MHGSGQSAGLIGLMQRRATGKTVLVLFAVAMTVYLVMLLITIPRIEAYAPDVALFDLSPTGYSHAEAMLLLDSLGPEGRDAYLFPQLALDFVYPGLFAVCYSLMLTWVFAQRFRPESRIFYLAILPVFAGLFDYVENLLIIRMIMVFPDFSEGSAAAASIATVLKSAFTTGTFFLLILGVAFFIKKRPEGRLEVGTQFGTTAHADE